jgi:hypothetical protein
VIGDENLLELVDMYTGWREVNVNDQLSLKQKAEVNALVQEFEDITTDFHKIESTDKMSTCDRLDTWKETIYLFENSGVFSWVGGCRNIQLYLLFVSYSETLL